jgi:hypothetical protein
MNLKLFTLATLFLFCLFKANAQVVQSPMYNEIDVVLKVKDSADTQKFELATGTDTYYAMPSDRFVMNIDLLYGATEDITGYFRVKFKFAESEVTDNVDSLLRGITTPVLIPPVKKKKQRSRPLDSITYPYTTDVKYPILDRNYLVTAILLRYDTLEDYLDDDSENFTPVHSTNFCFLKTSATPLTNEAVVITTFPNPISNHINIVYAVGSGSIQDVPLEVSIFDDSGILVSQNTLPTSTIDNTSVSYYLDTSQLPAGIYFFQLVRNGGTTTKTIIKQ